MLQHGLRAPKKTCHVVLVLAVLERNLNHVYPTLATAMMIKMKDESPINFNAVVPR